MTKNTIVITLLAYKRAGILPILIDKLSSLGLIYLHYNVKEYQSNVKLILNCEGELKRGESFLIKSIRDVPGVDSVMGVTQSNATKTETETETVDSFKEGVEETVEKNTAKNFKRSAELQPLYANDPITNDVLHIVEDRLADIYGPTTNILLKSATKKSTVVGELFLILAKEITEDQKVLFLRNIEGLDAI